MTGTSGRAAFAFGKNSRPLIPGMLMSERIRINDREAAGAEVAPKLLAKKNLYIRFVVDDENKETHMLSPALRGALEISLSRPRGALRHTALFSIRGSERILFYTQTVMKKCEMLHMARVINCGQRTKFQPGCGSTKRDTSGPNLTVRFAWGFPEGPAYASLGDARANEHPIEPRRPSQA